MTVERQFLRNAATEPGTDGSTIFDLSATQGSPAADVQGIINDTVFTEVLRWQRTVDDTISGTSFPTSIDVSALGGSVDFRWRIQRINSSGVVQASSAYSQTESTTGIKTAALTLDTVWAAGDRLALSLEIARTGGHGNVTIDVATQDADSHVDADFAASEVNGSGAGDLPALTGSGTATAEVSGSGAGTLGALSGSGNADAPIDASGSGDLAALSGSGAGTVESAAINGSGQGDLAPLTGSGNATVEVEASGFGDLGPLEGAGNGGAVVSGSGTGTLGPVSGSGQSNVVVEASGTGLLSPLEGSGTGTVVSAGEITGSGSGDLGALTGSGSGSVDVGGSGAGDLPALEGSGSGTVGDVVTGSGAGSLGSLSGSGAGSVEVTATGQGDLDALTAAGSGTVTVDASGTGQLGAASGSGAATVIVSGSGAGTLPPLSGSGFEVAPEVVLWSKSADYATHQDKGGTLKGCRLHLDAGEYYCDVCHASWLATRLKLLVFGDTLPHDEQGVLPRIPLRKGN